jgi:toxin ParE1/3/4
MVPPSSRLLVRFTSAAADDLDVAFAFVSERNRSASADLLARLREATDRLSAFPEIGTALPSEEFGFVAPGIRFVVVEPYLVFYRVTGDGVVVLRILHARQDSLGALFE